MAKPVAGKIYYDTVADRPRVDLRSGSKKLLTEDDSGGGGAVSDVTSGSAAIDVSPTTGNVVVSLDESELENGGAQEISIAGLSGQAADGQRASALVTTGADVNVAAAAPGVAGNVLTLTDATHGVWLAPSADPRQYYTDDGSWHADSDDFNAATLNARWVAVNNTALTTPVTPSGAIDATTTPGSNVIRYGGGHRTTFGQFQFNPGGGIKRKQNAGSRSGAFQLRWRPVSNSVVGSSFLYLAADNGAGTGPDLTNNYLRLFIGNISTSPPNFEVLEFGSGAQANQVLIPADKLTSDFEVIVVGNSAISSTAGYVLIRSNGHLYDIAGNHTSGSWNLPTTTGGILWIYLRWSQGSTSATGGGSPVHTIDYLRERRDIIVLP